MCVKREKVRPNYLCSSTEQFVERMQRYRWSSYRNCTSTPKRYRNWVLILSYKLFFFSALFFWDSVTYRAVHLSPVRWARRHLVGEFFYIPESHIAAWFNWRFCSLSKMFQTLQWLTKWCPPSAKHVLHWRKFCTFLFFFKFTFLYLYNSTRDFEICSLSSQECSLLHIV
jgi:hypothetical protein